MESKDHNINWKTLSIDPSTSIFSTKPKEGFGSNLELNKGVKKSKKHCQLSLNSFALVDKKLTTLTTLRVDYN
jgi:hypothetical protein